MYTLPLSALCAGFLPSDKLLLNTAKEAIRQLWIDLLNCKSGNGEYKWLNTCGKDGVLTTAVKTRIKMEGGACEANVLLKSMKMDKDYDSNDRECFSCFYDLHLTAVSCQCTPNCFACLNYAILLCSFGVDRKIIFFRYSMEELNTLVAALEGDPAAVCCWGQDHLGLVCQSGSLIHEAQTTWAVPSSGDFSLSHLSLLSQQLFCMVCSQEF